MPERRTLDEQGTHQQRGGAEARAKKMTEKEPKQHRAQRGSSSMTPSHKPNAGSGHEEGHHGGLFSVEGFEDFEEFVLDFEDYDLLESIHTHLGSPVDPGSKSEEEVGT